MRRAVRPRASRWMAAGYARRPAPRPSAPGAAPGTRPGDPASSRRIRPARRERRAASRRPRGPEPETGIRLRRARKRRARATPGPAPAPWRPRPRLPWPRVKTHRAPRSREWWTPRPRRPRPVSLSTGPASRQSGTGGPRRPPRRAAARRPGPPRPEPPAPDRARTGAVPGRGRPDGAAERAPARPRPARPARRERPEQPVRGPAAGAVRRHRARSGSSRSESAPAPARPDAPGPGGAARVAPRRRFARARDHPPVSSTSAGVARTPGRRRRCAPPRPACARGSRRCGDVPTRAGSPWRSAPRRRRSRRRARRRPRVRWRSRPRRTCPFPTPARGGSASWRPGTCPERAPRGLPPSAPPPVSPVSRPPASRLAESASRRRRSPDCGMRCSRVRVLAPVRRRTDRRARCRVFARRRPARRRARRRRPGGCCAAPSRSPLRRPAPASWRTRRETRAQRTPPHPGGAPGKIVGLPVCVSLRAQRIPFNSSFNSSTSSPPTTRGELTVSPCTSPAERRERSVRHGM